MFCEICNIEVPDLILHQEHHRLNPRAVGDASDLICPACGKLFSLKRNCTRHALNCGQTKLYKCECGSSYKRADNLKTHQRKCNGKVNEQVKKPDKTWLCPYCNISVPENQKLKHYQSVEHKEKALIPTSVDTFLVDSCFEGNIVTYRIINNERTNLSMQSVLKAKRANIIHLLKQQVKKHHAVNFQAEVTTRYSKDDPAGETVDSTFYVLHKYADLNLSQVNNDEILNNKLDEVIDQLCSNSVEITTKGSGWTISDICHIDLKINKKVVLIGGGAFINLPEYHRKKKACINPEKDDNECFKWCIKAYLLYKILKKEFACKINSLIVDKALSSSARSTKIKNEYLILRRKLSNISITNEELVDRTYPTYFQGVEFPMKIVNIEDFMELNPHINVNVFGISAVDEQTVVGPLFASRRKAEHNINLLYLNDDEQAHYCWIKDLSRLVARQRKHKRSR